MAANGRHLGTANESRSGPRLMQPNETPRGRKDREESHTDELSALTGKTAQDREPTRYPAGPPRYPAVLYVDDDPNDARLMQAAWMRVGLRNQLHIVTDGEAALRYLSGHAPYENRAEYPMPYLIMLDLKLPKMSGIEVLKRLRVEPSTQMLRVMLLSASSGWLELEVAHTWHVLQQTLRIDGFLVKPATFDDWVDMVESLQGWLKRSAQTQQ